MKSTSSLEYYIFRLSLRHSVISVYLFVRNLTVFFSTACFMNNKTGIFAVDIHVLRHSTARLSFIRCNVFPFTTRLHININRLDLVSVVCSFLILSF